MKTTIEHKKNLFIVVWLIVFFFVNYYAVTFAEHHTKNNDFEKSSLKILEDIHELKKLIMKNQFLSENLFTVSIKDFSANTVEHKEAWTLSTKSCIKKIQELQITVKKEFLTSDSQYTMQYIQSIYDDLISMHNTFFTTMESQISNKQTISDQYLGLNLELENLSGLILKKTTSFKASIFEDLYIGAYIIILLLLISILIVYLKLTKIESILEYTRCEIVEIHRNKISYASPFCREKLSYLRTRLSALGLVNLAFPEDREPIIQMIENSIKNCDKSVSYTYKIFDKNGELAWKKSLLFFTYSKNNIVVKMMILTFDISQECLENKKLTEMILGYQTLIDNSPNMYFIKDNNFEYLIVNKAYANCFDKPIEEIIGQTDQALLSEINFKCMHNNDLEVIQSNYSSNFQELVHGKLFNITKFPIKFNQHLYIGGIVMNYQQQNILEKKMFATCFL